MQRENLTYLDMPGILEETQECPKGSLTQVLHGCRQLVS